MLLSIVPNLITLLNLGSGCMGIVFLFQGDRLGSILCVGFSLLFDFLDGLLARLLKQQHSLGKDLDSLADVVSFGVLPGCMFYELFSKLSLPGWFSFTGFLFTLAGAYRLARFNVRHSTSSHFTGLPIPSAAVFTAGLFWIGMKSACQPCVSIFINPFVLSISLLLMSYLMLSRIPHFSLKGMSWSWKGSQWQWTFLVLVMVMVFLLRELAVSMSIVLYILLSLVYFTIHPKTS